MNHYGKNFEQLDYQKRKNAKFDLKKELEKKKALSIATMSNIKIQVKRKISNIRSKNVSIQANQQF